ncbi:MAG: hypothetical protein GY930_16685 [bacterium]|nr:hypothetical protein [bacterium]
MKKRSNRGAARVNAIWLIVLLVLFFASLFFAVTANDEQGRAEKNTEIALADTARAQAELETLQVKARAITEIIGYFDETDLSAITESQALKDGLEALKDAIGTDAEAANTFEDAWPLAISQVAARNITIGTVTQESKDRSTQLAAVRQSAAETASEKDAELSTARQEYSDLESNTREQINNLEKQVARLTQERNAQDQAAIDARNELADLRVTMALNENANTSRLAKVTKITRPLREPSATDGEITGVSNKLNLAWINRGTMDRAVRGMVFKVVDANAANPRLKGEVEILEVFENTSKVAIRMVSDQYDAIAIGDKIANPLYDPEGRRNAVLAGRFDGKYSRQEVALMLKEVGIDVQKEVDQSTMFLIMGNPLYTDPETGESLEEAREVSSLPAYSKAKSIGVQLISLAEIRHFFRR